MRGSRPIHVRVGTGIAYASPTLVQRTYSSMLAAMEAGGDIEDILARYMPLLLSELDKILVLYPWGADVFRSVLERLWEQWFPEIPAPEVTERDSAASVFAKAKNTLTEHRQKLPWKEARVAVTTQEIEEAVNRVLLSFFNSLCTAVFSAMGLQI